MAAMKLDPLLSLFQPLIYAPELSSLHHSREHGIEAKFDVALYHENSLWQRLYVVSCPIEKLGVEASTVQHGVEGLMYLLTECSKLMVRNT